MARRMDDNEALAVKHDFVLVFESVDRVEPLLVLTITATAKIDAIYGLAGNAGGCKQALEYAAIIGTANHRCIPLVHVHIGSRCFGDDPGKSEMVGVGVRQYNPFYRVKSVAQLRKAFSESYYCLFGIRPGIDQRQGV